MATDGVGLPLRALLSAGQDHESRYLEAVLDSIRVCRPSGTVRQRPERVSGDKAYSCRRVRLWLRQRGVRAVIPERKDQIANRRGRPPKFDREQYRRRNVVERCIGWLKEARAVATRYEKLALHYLASIQIVIIRRYLKTLANRP